MGQLTLVHCLKDDRKEHLVTHLNDAFMKTVWDRDPGNSLEGLIQDGNNSIPGSIEYDWKTIRQDWDVDYYEEEDA